MERGQGKTVGEKKFYAPFDFHYFALSARRLLFFFPSLFLLCALVAHRNAQQPSPRHDGRRRPPSVGGREKQTAESTKGKGRGRRRRERSEPGDPAAARAVAADGDLGPDALARSGLSSPLSPPHRLFLASAPDACLVPQPHLCYRVSTRQRAAKAAPAAKTAPAMAAAASARAAVLDPDPADADDAGDAASNSQVHHPQRQPPLAHLRRRPRRRPQAHKGIPDLLRARVRRAAGVDSRLREVRERRGGTGSGEDNRRGVDGEGGLGEGGEAAVSAAEAAAAAAALLALCLGEDGGSGRGGKQAAAAAAAAAARSALVPGGARHGLSALAPAPQDLARPLPLGRALHSVHFGFRLFDQDNALDCWDGVGDGDAGDGGDGSSCGSDSGAQLFLRAADADEPSVRLGGSLPPRAAAAAAAAAAEAAAADSAVLLRPGRRLRLICVRRKRCRRRRRRLWRPRRLRRRKLL